MRAAREGLGLSFRQAEERTGVPFASIQRVEAGRVDPSLELLYRLAVGYGVPVCELLCGEEPPAPGPKKKPGRPPKDAAGR
jgi:transcriptional regulator with XRE-family HTH domain